MPTVVAPPIAAEERFRCSVEICASATHAQLQQACPNWRLSASEHLRVFKGRRSSSDAASRYKSLQVNWPVGIIHANGWV